MTMLTEAMAKRITLDFLRTESASGAILAAAAGLAIVLANSPWAGVYFGFIEHPITVQLDQPRSARPYFLSATVRTRMPSPRSALGFVTIVAPSISPSSTSTVDP